MGTTDRDTKGKAPQTPQGSDDPERTSKAGSTHSRASTRNLPPPSPSSVSSQQPAHSDLPVPPTITQPTQDELNAMYASITRKTLLHKHKRSDGSGSGSDVDEDVDTADIAQQLRTEAACLDLKSRHIELIADGHAVHSEAGLGDAPVPDKSFAWEVMYENQRGMTYFGKSWYSSNSLLPTDPTAFTLPQKLPSTAVAESEVVGGKPSTTMRMFKSKLIRKSIRTAYTPQTLQTPNPAWVWLTPWMVNMRTQTDEQGWEYNLWFHKSSWRAHPGHLNWWGWVRRREWVRLRQLVPEVVEKANEEVRAAAEWDRGKSGGTSDASREASRPASPGTREESRRQSSGSDTSTSESDAEIDPERISLAEIIAQQKPVLYMVKLLATVPLDRQKSELLVHWLDGAGAEDIDRLKSVFEDKSNLETLGRAFIFPGPRNKMFQQLTDRGIVPQRMCNECWT